MPPVAGSIVDRSSLESDILDPVPQRAALRDTRHAAETMAEALKLVAISFTKDVNRLSCCAS
jgi:hypothetical protein